MSNPSKVTLRRQASSTAVQQMEYDGTETPVLIRLPDLSAARTSSARPSDTSQASEPPASTRTGRKGRKRRVDRSHATNQQQPSAAPAVIDRILRSRITVAALVLAAAGITYLLVPSGSNREEQSPHAADPWAVEQPNENQVPNVQVAMPSTDSTMDLWPGESQAVSPQAPPLNRTPDFDPRQSVARDPSGATLDASRGVSLAIPSDHVSPVASEEFEQATPFATGVSPTVRAQQISNPNVQGWPDTPASPNETPAESGQPSTSRRQGGGARLELSTPAPTYSTPSPADPRNRTGMLPEPARGASEAYQQHGARLEGTIRLQEYRR